MLTHRDKAEDEKCGYRMRVDVHWGELVDKCPDLGILTSLVVPSKGRFDEGYWTSICVKRYETAGVVSISHHKQKMNSLSRDDMLVVSPLEGQLVESD